MEDNNKIEEILDGINATHDEENVIGSVNRIYERSVYEVIEAALDNIEIIKEVKSNVCTQRAMNRMVGGKFVVIALILWFFF